MRRLYVLALLGLTAVGALASVGSAQAAPTDPFQYKGSLAINPASQIAVNHQSGNLLTFDGETIRQFDPSGNPVNFASLGEPSITVGSGPFASTMLVDNTGGPMQGSIYVAEFSYFGPGGSLYWSYGPDGAAIGTNPVDFDGGSFERVLSGAAIAPDGNLQVLYWAANSDGLYYMQKVSPTGEKLGSRVPFPLNGSPRPSVTDDFGNFYSPGSEGTLRKYDGANGFADLGETGLPSSEYLAVEPSSNDIYSRQGSKVVGLHYSDPLVKGTPFTVIDGARGNGPFAFDATGQTLYLAEEGQIGVFHREPASAPLGLGQLKVDEINTTRAAAHGQLTTGGAATSYHFEYGPDTSYGSSTPEAQVPSSYFPVEGLSGALEGLEPNTTYHVRMVATNAVGTTPGPDKTFKTFAVSTGGANDTCPNALARKQTIAQRAPDCRAYELVSAADTDGYDVESYLAPGQTPFPGFPMATDKLLYATHGGAVPGPWHATNKGPDPYLATRTSSGWVTNYKGFPSNLNPQAGSFSSALGEADSQLNTLAFAGPNLCDPCFTDGGLRTGIPVRLPSGQLVQGMTGSLAASVPDTAKPEGKVARYFSADGQHLVFASKYAFEPSANTGGDLTVYDRNLATGTTQIVSTDQAGDPLAGTVSELDVSADGTRVVTAKQISLDGQGNAYTHPYMHIGSSPSSVDLAPGTTTGVLFAGMSADGSKVFFTTTDKLNSADTDASADLYEAAVDGSGNLDLSVITESDSDACNPVANTDGAHWNTVGAAANCDIVAIAGGGGVASASGAIYFLSPESFGGEGTANQPNLYRAEADESLGFVATLEPDNPLVLDSVKANGTRRTGDFQVTPSGGYAVFLSDLPLTGVHTFGVLQVFRHDAGAGQIVCVSCDTTNTDEDMLAEDAELAPSGLSILEDGKAFFTTLFPLNLNDANAKTDVYEFTQGRQEMISAGTGPFDSALLTASADGTDVFFFTHDTLAIEEDHNGELMKIYDARVGGGFFKLPPPVPCQAADECHGPGTVTPPPPDIRSSGKTTRGNVVVCPKNRVKKRGQCVKKPAQRKKKKAKKNAKKRNTKTTGKRGGHNA